jgi:hypothetical protein
MNGFFTDAEVQAIISDLEAFFTGNRRATFGRHLQRRMANLDCSIMKLLPDCPKRTRRAVMWTLLLNEARTRFGDDQDIHFKETRQGHFFILVPDALRGISILLRFKFLDNELHTRNYPTQTAIDYNKQMPLPGIPQGVRVDLGYRPNQDETALNGIFAVWSFGLQKLWVCQLDSAVPGIVRDIQLPTAASFKPIAPRRTRVKDGLIGKKNAKGQDPKV